MGCRDNEPGTLLCSGQFCRGSPIADEELGYGDDGGWNMTQRSVNGSPTSYTVNDRNQVTAIGAAETTVFDANGNLSWRWNAAGRNGLEIVVGPQELIEREQIASNWGLQEGAWFDFGPRFLFHADIPGLGGSVNKVDQVNAQNRALKGQHDVGLDNSDQSDHIPRAMKLEQIGALEAKYRLSEPLDRV